MPVAWYLLVGSTQPVSISRRLLVSLVLNRAIKPRPRVNCQGDTGPSSSRPAARQFDLRPAPSRSVHGHTGCMPPRRPEIAVPAWYQLPSGLIVPSSLGVAMPSQPEVPVPPELLSPPTPIAFFDNPPHAFDQILVHPTEDELGIPFKVTLDQLRSSASDVPFEPGMVAISRIAAVLWHIHQDGPAQVELARTMLGVSSIIDRMAAFVARGENHVVFSEQQMFIAQRLLIEHGGDGDLGPDLTFDQQTALWALIVGAGMVTDPPEEELGGATTQRLLAYLVQNGAYHVRHNSMNAFARAWSLFAEYARADTDDDRLPLDEWFAEDYKLSIEEQMAAGQALQAMSRVLDPDRPPNERSLIQPEVLSTTALRDRMDDVRAILAAPREWYRAAFAHDQSALAIAWDHTPFMQRPFLELSTGQLVLLSPRAITAWLGDGFYYRLLDAAQRRNPSDTDRRVSRDFTKYVGKLHERWALDVVRSAYPGDRPPGSGTVHGEQKYGASQKTSDVLIDHGPDLVVIEMRSGFLTRDLRVTGDVEAFEKDIERVLLDKVRRLGTSLQAILDGRATVPGVDIGTVERAWPILVTANVTQSEPLHDLVESELPEIFADPRVQSLLILDSEDLEYLIGIVEAGGYLPDILARRQESPWRRLEFARWANESPGSPGKDSRPSFATEKWETAIHVLQDVLDVEEPEPTDS